MSDRGNGGGGKPGSACPRPADVAPRWRHHSQAQAEQRRFAHTRVSNQGSMRGWVHGVRRPSRSSPHQRHQSLPRTRVPLSEYVHDACMRTWPRRKRRTRAERHAQSPHRAQRDRGAGTSCHSAAPGSSGGAQAQDTRMQTCMQKTCHTPPPGIAARMAWERPRVTAAVRFRGQAQAVVSRNTPATVTDHATDPTGCGKQTWGRRAQPPSQSWGVKEIALRVL